MLPNMSVYLKVFSESKSYSRPQVRPIHTYIHKLYLSSDFSVAYIASISDPN